VDRGLASPSKTTGAALGLQASGFGPSGRAVNHPVHCDNLNPEQKMSVVRT